VELLIHFAVRFYDLVLKGKFTVMSVSMQYDQSFIKFYHSFSVTIF